MIDRTYVKLLAAASEAAAEAMDEGVGALHVGGRVLDAIGSVIDSVYDSIEGQPDSLTVRIEQALLSRHPVTLSPDRARNYAEIAAFVANGGQ